MRLAALILRRRRLIVGLPILSGLVFGLILLLSGRTYTSRGSFMPQSSEASVSRLAGLAAQLGFSVPGSEGGQSPQFYADLLTSRALLQDVLLDEYTVETADGPGRGTLLDLLGIEGDTEALRLDNGIEALRGDLTVRTSAETGVVSFGVTTPWPTLSKHVAEGLIDGVHEFNQRARRSLASAERIFTEQQLARAQEELLASEDSLEAFLQRNRRYENSPELRFQHDRLERRVGFRQQVFTSLAQSYEQAKIDEVRNTPVVTVVETPASPAKADSRGTIVKSALAMAVTGMLVVLWVLAMDFFKGSQERDPREFHAFEEARNEAMGDLKRVLSRFRRTSSPPAPD